MYRELKYSQTKMNARILQIEQEIEESGIYTHTLEELTYGAKWHGEIQIVVSVDYFGNR